MIYLDYNASTPMAPEVKEAMTLAWDQYGNPSGTHTSARSAEALFESARDAIASKDLPIVSVADVAITGDSVNKFLRNTSDTSSGAI